MSGLIETGKRLFTRVSEHGLTDWAAALTYYAVLALFPGLIALVGILGLVGSSATDPLLENLEGLAPGAANDILTGAIEEVATGRGAAGFAFVLGLGVAIWSASGYIGAFSRASNAIHETEETRSFVQQRPQQLALTLLLLVLVAVLAIGVVVSGPIAAELGGVVGVGDSAVTAWNIAKWPVIGLMVLVILAVLYYAAPDVDHERVRLLTAGGALTVIAWLAASAGFTFYVSSFASYNATYGSLAGVIVFLVWLWISNLALLLGAELNAELEERRGELPR